MLILVPLRMITIMLKRCGAFVFGLRHENKYKNANNCWYLGICEHDQFHAWSSWEWNTYILPNRLGIMRRFVGNFVLCFAFGLSLDRVVGYADWSHTFWSCKGGNGSDWLCDGIFVTFKWKKNVATSWPYAHSDVIYRIFTFLRWIPNIIYRVCWKH